LKARLPFRGADRRNDDSAPRGGLTPAPTEDVTAEERIEQIVESTSIEIERISEGQRFTTRLLGEKRPVES